MSALPLELVAQVRNLRNEKNIAPKVTLNVGSEADYPALAFMNAFIEKLANCNLQLGTPAPANTISILIGTQQVWVEMEDTFDVEAEKSKLSDEIIYLEGFLKSVNAKLNNEKFVANAKGDVVDKERQKKSDAEEKIESLKQQIQNLS
jgi:valyl-tRNA synthetase